MRDKLSHRPKPLDIEFSSHRNIVVPRPSRSQSSESPESIQRKEEKLEFHVLFLNFIFFK